MTAGDGDVVVRVFPGMWLGETETGELSLDGSDALLSLSIGIDESLVVFAVNGGELDDEDGEFCGRRHLAFDSAALIRLPNNNVRLDKDMLSEAGTNAPLLPCAVWRAAGTENQPAATDSVDTPQPPLLSEPNKSEHNRPEDIAVEPIAAEPIAAELSRAEPDEEQSIAVPMDQPIPQQVHDETPNREQKRPTAIVASASAALACVLIGLGYVSMREPATPEQLAPVTPEVVAEVEAAATVEEAPITEPAPIDRPDIIADVITADDLTSAPAVVDEEPFTQNLPTLEIADPAVALVEAAQIEEARIEEARLEAAEREAARLEAARIEAAQKEAANAARAAALAKAETEAQSQREQEQAQTAQVRYERDLLAAELALAQGRLTEPSEDNAYSLYQSLVASNPESSEARRGFQAVGAALVNRAFAELAARRWSEARATLTAAAEAGASPNLVANLSGEVDYQQRLADAEAGRFATLYPEAELVALNRTTPRLRRFAPDDIDQVQIEFTISAAGTVQDIEVLGAPPQRLERAVRQAVTDWRFEPVLSGNRPIPVRTRVGLDIP